MSCELCQLPLKSDGRFCCSGCEMVFNVLKQRGEISSLSSSRLYREAVASGIISQEFAVQKNKPDSAEIVKKIYFEVKNLFCTSCPSVIQWILEKKEGVISCFVDYSTDLGVIEFIPLKTDKEALFQSIGALGYQIDDLQAPVEEKKMGGKVSFAISFFCALNIMMCSFPLYAHHFSLDAVQEPYLFAQISFLLAVPLLLLGGYPIFKRAFYAFKASVFGMEGLVTLASLSAFMLSSIHLFQGSNDVYFDAMALVITLMMVGKSLEKQAKFSVREAFVRILRSLPKKVRVVIERGVEYRIVFAKDVLIGQEMALFSGERVPLDGEVIAGEALCDSSSLTGESLPRFINKGSLVKAGELIVQGTLFVKVQSLNEKSTLMQLIEKIEFDIKHRGEKKNKVEEIFPFILVGVFAMALSLLLFGAYVDLDLAERGRRAIALLLICCPCAIGIAAPLIETQMMAKAAELGVVIQRRSVIQDLGEETVYVFDKTGTLTEGRLQVSAGLSQISLLEKSLLKSLVQHSNHPFSLAIDAHITDKPKKIDLFHEELGKGLKGFYNKKLLLLGSKAWIKEHRISVAYDAATYFFYDDHLYPIDIDDSIREDAKPLLDSLSSLKKVLLSGDLSGRVEKMGKLLEFDQFYGGCLPDEKRAKINEFKKLGHTVAMVGDGVNDAAPFAVADVTIGVQKAQDLTLNLADIVLQKDLLLLIPKVRQLARYAKRLIFQNYFWAFSYNGIGIILALMGRLTPLISAVAMILSSLVILLNAFRLKRYSL